VKLIIGISGASGVNLSLKFIELLPKEIEKYVIVSDNSKIVFDKENNINILDNKDISEITASGSFKSDAMIILPCSMNTLAKISSGISDNLITRTASVMLKERRKLILAPREMPYGTISLENMAKLSLNGVIIAPPVLGYYSEQQSLEDMEKFLIGKWFDLLDIEHNLFKRWGEK
jgi:4-hydroxy-3-polyprenylbenzoate decarboxylase